MQPAREQDTVKVLEGQAATLRRKQKYCSILSVKHFPKFPNQVFVWANGSIQLQNICSLYSWIMHRNIVEVDDAEWLRSLSTLDDSFEFNSPSWVRIELGLYRHDLAMVERSYSNGFLDVLVVPRLRKQHGKKRPTPHLLPHSAAIAIFGAKVIKEDASNPDWFRFRKSLIKHGLQCIYIDQKKVRSGLPNSLAEVSPFVEASAAIHFPKEIQSFIFDTASDIKSVDLLTVFEPGDRVTVAVGSLLGTYGNIREILNETVATVTLHSVDSEGRDVDLDESASHSFSLKDLRRVFRVGDHIRVRCGRESGRSGIITKVDGPAITFADKNLRTSEGSGDIDGSEVGLELIAVSSL